MDDNGRLLFLSRDGMSVATLRQRGVLAADSQINLLETFDMVRREGDVVTTTIPVLGPDQMVPLRKQSAQLAEIAAKAISADVALIQTELNRRNHGGNTFSVVFGHALDGLFWDRLRYRGALPETTLTLKQPFWRGAYWAVFPKRSGTAGTNQVIEGHATLVMTWSDTVTDRLNGYAQAAEMRAILKSYGRAGTGDPSRSPLLLTLRGKNDPLHILSDKVATSVASIFIDSTEGRALLAAVPATREEAVVIMGHELIWDVTDGLIKTGALSRPAALDGKPNTPLEPLLFVRLND